MATNEVSTGENPIDQIVVKAHHIRAVADLVCVWAEENSKEMPQVIKGTLSSAMDLIISETVGMERLI